MNKNMLCNVSVFALIAATDVSIAQEDTDDVIALEPITITSAKREQDAFELPAKVSVATTDDISRRGVQSTADIDKLFPSIAIDGRSSRVFTNYTIRGQSSLDFYNPSVQLYIDGLPQDSGSLSQAFPSGLDSVEVLYGPQGTLYGRGAIGGVINIVTRKPGEGEKLSFSIAGSNNGYDVNILGEAQIADGLWADVGLIKSREDAELAFQTTGAEIGETTEEVGRFRLRYAPTDSPLDIMFTVQRSELESEEEQYVRGTNLAGRIAVPFPSRYEQSSNLYGLNISYDLDWGVVTSVTSLQDRKLDRTIFGSFTPETQKTLTQEFRLASKPGGAIDYVAGLYASKVDFTRQAFGASSQQDIDSYAAFADVTWHVNDRLDISPGLRYDYEKVNVSASGGVNLTGEDSFSALSPKLAASYSVNDQWQLYGLINSGFKAGGFTRTLTAANIAFTYDPQKTWNTEVGAKYRSTDGSVEASISAYYNRTSDYQMFVGTPPVSYLQNVGEVTSKGIDANLRLQKGDLGLSAGIGLNDTTFTDYSNPVAPALNLTGNRVPYAPKITAQLALDYTINLTNGTTVIPRIGVSYQSEVFFDESNSIGQDSYALVDAGIAWHLKNNATLDLYAANLADEVYTNYGFDGTGFGVGQVFQVGRGREVGLRITKSF